LLVYKRGNEATENAFLSLATKPHNADETMIMLDCIQEHFGIKNIYLFIYS